MSHPLMSHPRTMLMLVFVIVACNSPYKRWAVLYTADAAPGDFDEHSTVVLDSDHHPPLAPLKAEGKRVLAYLSLGQAESHRRYFERARTAGVLIDTDPLWPGAYTVDIRSWRWTNLVLSRLPAILDKGFDGFFLDTLDSPLALEREDQARYGGMSKAGGYLVRAIRERHPSAHLMLNRSYEVVPVVDEYLDSLVGESTLTRFDHSRGRYVLKARDEYRREIEPLLQARRRHPELELYTLDYWDVDDAAGIADIYRRQRSHGLVPYVATRRLDQLVPEPRARAQ